MKAWINTTLLVAVITTLLLNITACQNGGPVSRSNSENDSLNMAAERLVISMVETGNAERTLALIDSLTDQNRLSPVKADYYRAAVYSEQGNQAKYIEYLNRIVKTYDSSDEDPLFYSKVTFLLTNQYMVMNQYEEALRVALPAIAKFKPDPAIPSDKKGKLLAIIGACQKKLNRLKEAEKSFEQAYRYYVRYKEDEDMDLTEFSGCINSVQNIFNVYTDAETLKKQQKWTDRCDSLLKWYRNQPDADPSFVDRTEGQIALKRAEILLKQGKKMKAAMAYEQFLKTDYSKEDDARINSLDYLCSTGHYNEAADILQDFDRLAAEWGMKPNLEIIVDFLFPKFDINYHAGRKDSALAVAVKISELIDSAVTAQKKDAAAELATIYEMQEKEAQIVRQQAELSQQRETGLIIAIISLIIFFIIFTLVRYHAAKRLAEVRSAQERIENELKIARDIQMSMVPSTFPKREGLNMYASMTPAKEVGGDLYGYVMNNSSQSPKLYFAVGDVSGKGVPASLFMAQAMRLFKTQAKLGMMPADICTSMNDALSDDDNENSMFVTLFIGLLDLTTGHLNFCNAGHNPPVIGGGANQGDFLNMKPNAPIGLWPELVYEGEEIDTIKGRPLFIYTDGLNEAENNEQEQFGDERLLDILRQTHYASAQQVIETIAEAVSLHRDGAEPNDDLTMMCIHMD